MQADSPVADEAADRRTDEIYGTEYGPVPIEREHSLYHPSPSPVPVPSRTRDPSDRFTEDPEYNFWRRCHPPPFFCGNVALRYDCFEDDALLQEARERRNAFRHGGGRSMANTTPRATAWRAGSGLTDDKFKMAMAALKKQAYAPSSSPQKQTAFRRVVSGIFRTQKTADIADEEEKACTICLETFRPGEQVVVTPCSHMFHQGCVAPWVKGHGNCPVCRFVLRN